MRSVDNYTIDIKNVDDSVFNELAQLSAYGNICILAKDVNMNEANDLVRKLSNSGCRKPFITDRVIGTYLENKEDINCILSSI